MLGLPGQSADDDAAMVKEAFQLALSHRVPRLRFAFYMGENATPMVASVEEEKRFMESHPDWHQVEYRGVQDLIALNAMAQPGLVVTGPAA